MVAELNEKKIRLIEKLLHVSDEDIITGLLDYFSAEENDLSLGKMSEEDLKSQLRASNEDISARRTITNEDLKKRFR